MEFHQKLQELRKQKGLTQEELAEILFVSRTAVSKWESGRGMPNIESLKAISKYFSVSIDALLSSETLLSIAEQENRDKIQNICDRLIGITDLFALLLIVLPLYPRTVDGYVYSVNLFAYTETTVLNRSAYWILFLALVLIGGWNIAWMQGREGTKRKIKQKTVTSCSILLSIATVLYLALAGETYAVMMVFLLLVVKGMLLFKYFNQFSRE